MEAFSHNKHGNNTPEYGLHGKDFIPEDSKQKADKLLKESGLKLEIAPDTNVSINTDVSGEPVFVSKEERFAASAKLEGSGLEGIGLVPETSETPARVIADELVRKIHWKGVSRSSDFMNYLNVQEKAMREKMGKEKMNDTDIENALIALIKKEGLSMD